MSHNITNGSAVECGDLTLRNRQVDVDSSELEGFKEMFQVFSLTPRYVTPDGNCMPLSVAEITLCQDMSGGHERKEISEVQHEARVKEIRQGAVSYVEQHPENFEGFLVTKKRTQQLGALEDERQRTVKE
jgi:hypothetical protein